MWLQVQPFALVLVYKYLITPQLLRLIHISTLLLFIVSDHIKNIKKLYYIYKKYIKKFDSMYFRIKPFHDLFIFFFYFHLAQTSSFCRWKLHFTCLSSFYFNDSCNGLVPRLKSITAEWPTKITGKKNRREEKCAWIACLVTVLSIFIFKCHCWFLAATSCLTSLTWLLY